MTALMRLAGIIAGLSLWRACLLALALGALSGLGFAPFHLGWIFALTLPPFVWSLDAAVALPLRRRFLRGFMLGGAFGFGMFFVSLSWIYKAFLVDPAFAALAPFAVVLLPLLLALFTACGMAGAGVFWRDGWERIVVLAITWTLADLLRGSALSGFPWNLPGQLWVASDALLQTASVIGVHGMSFLTILFAAAPAALVRLAGVRLAGAHRTGSPTPAIAALAALALLWGAGQARLVFAIPPPDTDVRIHIIQPNIPQVDKWNPDKRNYIIRRFYELSARAVDDTRGPSVLVWPESALPLLIDRHKPLREAIGRLLPDNATLFIGALSIRDAEGTRPRQAFNALHVMDTDGTIRATYDKLHLVPFGEYLPAQDFLESLGFSNLTQQRGGFTAGTKRALLESPGAPPALPLICYEIIFPLETPGTDARPGWILNVTNDAWFGQSAGPLQHFDIARLRAVEQGLPVIRAANTGISAVIDGYGRIRKSAALNTQGVVSAALPGALPPPLRARLHILPLVFLLGAGGLVLAWRARTTKRATVEERNARHV